MLKPNLASLTNRAKLTFIKWTPEQRPTRLGNVVDDRQLRRRVFELSQNDESAEARNEGQELPAAGALKQRRGDCRKSGRVFSLKKSGGDSSKLDDYSRMTTKHLAAVGFEPTPPKRLVP
jgi:hypothetical protein